MKGKVVFVNPAGRLAAAYVGNGQCILFEYQGIDHFKVGELIASFKSNFGPTMCFRPKIAKKSNINILSNSLTYDKAKLIVSPYSDIRDDMSLTA